MAEIDAEITEQIVSEMLARAAGHAAYARNLRRDHPGNDELVAWAARCDEFARRWTQLADDVAGGRLAQLDREQLDAANDPATEVATS